MKAEDLIVKPLNLNHDSAHAFDKLNELIDKHNIFVRSTFDREDTIIDISLVNAPNKIDIITQTLLAAHPSPGFTDLQILNLVHVLALWGWRCLCVAPVKVKKGPIFLCKECSKPVHEEDND